MASEIKVASLVTGELVFDKDSKVEVTSVDIFLNGIENKIATVKPVISEFGASISHVIDAKARAGEYTIVWNKNINGKQEEEVNIFMIHDDSIDRTLPVELQHLS